LCRRHISSSGLASTATETAVFALFLPVQPSNWYYMVQMDFLAANHVRIVRLCGQAHHVVVFAMAQLSCYTRSRIGLRQHQTSLQLAYIKLPFHENCIILSYRGIQRHPWQRKICHRNPWRTKIRKLGG